MDERRPPEDPIPSPVCLAFVRKLGRTPEKAGRQRILAACGRIARPWSEELLWESLADPNEGIRDYVVRELCGRAEISPEWAVRRLHLPPWYARSAALAVIGRRRLRETLPGIGAVVGDANADVRRAAAEALGEIGGEEAVRLLVRLKKDANPYVRTAAEAAIGRTSGVRFS
ncbi:MAG TPA: HEAT repeat domain-containing protein [Candidatus Aminicenantes bacterium]|nr:HEAT repeat domain-containing protein [Candidatus Aminicenantes bacterium]HRY64332.1 HEAT repeat domain-containing protein [Candidatus Aminicenantes bacterium]HRZ71245.1 HEAT repeat domain-containing protein [Candidatus Aminicenantes bacterium]